MLDLPEIDSASTALLAGLVTSLHCTGMCGPLACLIMPTGREQGDALTVGTLYHSGRLISYGLLGALAGGFGHLTVGLLENSILRWLPWLLVLFFIGLAFHWERHLPRLARLTGVGLRFQGWLRSRPKTQAGLMLGFATPLLPCGPLYFALAAALIAGNALRGAEFMFTFALGTMPLLWLAQSRYHWLRSKLSPLTLDRLRMGLALLAALLVAWRLRGTLGFEGPGLENFTCCF
jgi:sulfite exporter TauE/SafE